MKAPISNLKDADMRAAPIALMRAAEKARCLAERTGTPFVVRQSVDTSPDAARIADASASGKHRPAQERSDVTAVTPASGTPSEDLVRDEPGQDPPAHGVSPVGTALHAELDGAGAGTDELSTATKAACLDSTL